MAPPIPPLLLKTTRLTAFIFATNKMTITRRTCISASLLGSLLVGAVSLQGCDQSPLVVKIGAAQPLTGNLAPQGNDLLNGVLLAVEELNQSNLRVKGRKVTFEVVPVDDQANAEVGKRVAGQLVEAGVVAVIGHFNSGVSIAAAPIYAKESIAQLAISTNPKYTALGFDSTFRLVANDNLQAKAMGSFAASQFKAQRYAVIDDGTPYGKDLAQGVVQQLKEAKKEVVLQESKDDKITAFEDTAEKMKSQGAEVLVTTLNDFQIIALQSALAKISYDQVQILGGDSVKTNLMREGARPGFFVTSPILEPQEFNAGKAFLKKYVERFKVTPAYAGHYTYDAMQVLATAIRRADSTNPKDIVQMLHRLDGYGPVTGSMKWDAKGEQRYGVIGVYKATKESWEPLVRSDSW
jgi:branched-chain amino acid transport system substrate-binding protein